MATQILARGARRSAAPTYDRVDPTRSQALVADPELLRKLIFDTTAQGVVGDSYAGNSVAEAFGRGSFTETGQGSAQTGNTGTASPSAPGVAAGLGKGLSALGALTGNPSLSSIGGLTGFAGNVANASPSKALGAFGQLGLSFAGAPGGAVSLGRAVVNGDIAMGIDSALSLASPVGAAINGIAGLLGLGTFGSVIEGAVARGRGTGGWGGYGDDSGANSAYGGAATGPAAGPGLTSGMPSSTGERGGSGNDGGGSFGGTNNSAGSGYGGGSNSSGRGGSFA